MKSEGSSGRHQLVIQGILSHWIKCPDAKDVCDGICRWWLPEGLGDLGREKVQQALDMLVSWGWVTERRLQSGEKVYGLNKDRLKDIEDFLREAERKLTEDLVCIDGGFRRRFET